MAAKRCPKHPNYNALRKPKRTSADPNGCATCWEFYKTARSEEQETRSQPRKAATAKKVDSTIQSIQPGGRSFNVGRLKVDADTDGTLVVTYAGRSIFTADNNNDLDNFLMGFREGLKFREEA